LLHDPATQLAEIYNRCQKFLQCEFRPNAGLTMIISPRWFFVGFLTQPYYTTPSGNPIYLDGFDFAGLVSLQSITATWPATAGLEDQTISATDALTATTKVVSVIDELNETVVEE